MCLSQPNCPSEVIFSPVLHILQQKDFHCIFICAETDCSTLHICTSLPFNVWCLKLDYFIDFYLLIRGKCKTSKTTSTLSTEVFRARFAQSLLILRSMIKLKSETSMCLSDPFLLQVLRGHNLWVLYPSMCLHVFKLGIVLY